MHKLLILKLCLREINRNSFHVSYIDMLLIFTAKDLCCMERPLLGRYMQGIFIHVLKE